VIAEQQRRVAVGRREQPRPTVVEQVPLVDRLEPQRVTLLGERREDRLRLSLLLGAQRRFPEAPDRLLRDRVPEAGGYSQPASSFVQ
jgi:hypothetical protein